MNAADRSNLADRAVIDSRPDADIAFVEIGNRDFIETYACGEGSKDPLLKALHGWHTMQRTLAKDAHLAVFIDGYDSDPRELWDIPEVVFWTRVMVTIAEIMRDDRLLPSARAFLRAMGCDPQANPKDFQPKKETPQ